MKLINNKLVSICFLKELGCKDGFFNAIQDILKYEKMAINITTNQIWWYQKHDWEVIDFECFSSKTNKYGKWKLWEHKNV